MTKHLPERGLEPLRIAPPDPKSGNHPRRKPLFSRWETTRSDKKKQRKTSFSVTICDWEAKFTECHESRSSSLPRSNPGRNAGSPPGALTCQPSFPRPELDGSSFTRLRKPLRPNARD